MRIYQAFMLMIFVSGVLADTEKEVIIDCDANRTSDVICTACNVYHESRGEEPAGQLAVALVTRNRVQSHLYPNEYCDVVWEVRTERGTGRKVPMFSWTLDGKSDKIYNKDRWEIAVSLALAVVKTDSVYDYTIGSLWYHNLKVNPYWAKHYHPTVQVGRHQFYAENEETFLNTLIFNTLPKEHFVKINH